jgi:hypothetical protein
MTDYTNVIYLDYIPEIIEVHQQAPDIDDTPPVVNNFDPAPGFILNQNDPVSFDVTDDSGTFTRIIIAVWFKETGIQEIIHDGDVFTGYYSATSVRNIISNGFRYSVSRTGGWPHAPTIRAFPVDAAGNEA